jgi:hypothetical protein
LTVTSQEVPALPTTALELNVRLVLMLVADPKVIGLLAGLMV